MKKLKTPVKITITQSPSAFTFPYPKPQKLIKPKKTKKLTYSKAKKQAWDTFSKYIRVRDSRNGQAECFTCNFIFPIKNLQAGHFIPGRRNAILFDPHNCHAQCYRCNVPLKGNLIEYYPRMVDKYGLDEIERLKSLNCQTKQYKVFELVEIKEKYQQMIDELEGEKKEDNE